MALALLERELSIERPPSPGLEVAPGVTESWIHTLGQVCTAVETVVGSQKPKQFMGRVALGREAVYTARTTASQLGLMHDNSQVYIALQANKISSASGAIVLAPNKDALAAHQGLFATFGDLNLPEKRQMFPDKTSYTTFAVNAIGRTVDIYTPDATDSQRAWLAISLLNLGGIETYPIGRLIGEGSPHVLADDIQMQIPLTPNAPHVEEAAQSYGTYYAALDELGR